MPLTGKEQEIMKYEVLITKCLRLDLDNALRFSSYFKAFMGEPRSLPSTRTDDIKGNFHAFKPHRPIHLSIPA